MLNHCFFGCIIYGVDEKKSDWRLFLNSSTELNYQTYQYQRLFKKSMTETEVIDYLETLDPSLTATYTVY